MSKWRVALAVASVVVAGLLSLALMLLEVKDGFFLP